jgi:hypothetical protein
MNIKHLIKRQPTLFGHVMADHKYAIEISNICFHPIARLEGAFERHDFVLLVSAFPPPPMGEYL